AAGLAADRRSGDLADAMGDRVTVARPQRAHAGRDRTGDAGRGRQVRVADHAATRLYQLVQPPDAESAGQGGLSPRRALARDLYAPARRGRRCADGIDPPTSVTVV